MTSLQNVWTQKSVVNLICVLEINIQFIFVPLSFGSEYLPQPSASENIPTLGAIFIDIPHGRVEYL